MRLQIVVSIVSLWIAQSHGLGINCRGSSSCAGSSGTLSSLTAEICNHNPLSDTKPPGEHFAQAKCGSYTGAKAVFVQSTSQSLSYGQVCDYLRKLQSHGCKGCGSVPINPGNNVKNGQVTVNYVSQCSCTGGPDKCGVTKKRDLEPDHELAPEHDFAPNEELAPENELMPENELAPGSDQSPAPVLFKRLGINCRGSSSCPGIRVNNKNLVNEICNADPKQTWGPGEHIATACQDFDTGLAAFTQKTSERITQPRACELAKQIRGHGCNKCGSVPFQGKNVANGELTFNYVSSC